MPTLAAQHVRTMRATLTGVCGGFTRVPRVVGTFPNTDKAAYKQRNKYNLIGITVTVRICSFIQNSILQIITNFTETLTNIYGY
jgi:outer membrane protease